MIRFHALTIEHFHLFNRILSCLTVWHISINIFKTKHHFRMFSYVFMIFHGVSRWPGTWDPSALRQRRGRQYSVGHLWASGACHREGDGVPWDGNWMWADDNVNNVTWLHHLMLHPKTSKFEKFECVDHVLTMC